jgi:RNA polymerase sigma factor (sigma-70 family)
MSDSWEELADKPLPRYDNEIPAATWLLEQFADRPVPETELQAIMETRPGEPVPTSKQETRNTNERLADIVENDLSEDERSVIEVTVFAGHSIRNAAKILGLPKTTVHRLKISALARIEKLLEMGDDNV